jgi:hypothetical protein
MTPRLTPKGYELTKMKLANMEARLAALGERTDINPIHKAEVERSYIDMIRQYCREIKLYEAAQDSAVKPPPEDKPTSSDAGEQRR